MQILRSITLFLIALVTTLCSLSGQNAVDNAKAKVTFYRYRQYVGAALEPSIYADEVQLARMDNGRYAVFEFPAGKHVFRSNDKQSGVEIDIKSGQEYYVRVELATGFFKGHGRLVLTTQEQGTYEVAKLKALDPDKIKAPTQAVSTPPSIAVGTEAPDQVEVLTNRDILSLQRAGLGESVIVEKIRASQSRFSLQTADLVTLKTAGVSDAVIAAMIDAGKPK